MKKGGRLFYVGAGTSGRLGVLDASECPPTYGVSPEVVQGLMAGGEMALSGSKEETEDDPELGKRDLMEKNLTSSDTVLGIAASGRTPYVIGALQYANEIGAYTGSLSCTQNATISKEAKTAMRCGSHQRFYQNESRYRTENGIEYDLYGFNDCYGKSLQKLYG